MLAEKGVIQKVAQAMAEYPKEVLVQEEATIFCRNFSCHEKGLDIR